MQLALPPAEVARAGLRAVKTVALADGTFHDLERGFIASVQEHLLETEHDADALEPIDGAELARLVPPGEFRERILRAAVLTALIDGKASEAERDVVAGFARALGVDDAPFLALDRMVAGRLVLVRMDIARRSFLGSRLRGVITDRGLRGVADVVRAIAGLENEKLSSRYQALEHYASGTLGRAYWEFIRKNEFSLPGEKGGAPEPIVFHDCVHVLAEYDTDPVGETQILAFQGGFQADDPFFTVLFAVAEFHLGIGISPVATATKMAVQPELLIKALMRGTQCNRDLSKGWDPWDDFSAPVVELRRRYNIVPHA
jgi:tellurite resistance protein